MIIPARRNHLTVQITCFQTSTFIRLDFINSFFFSSLYIPPTYYLIDRQAVSTTMSASKSRRVKNAAGTDKESLAFATLLKERGTATSADRKARLREWREQVEPSDDAVEAGPDLTRSLDEPPMSSNKRKRTAKKEDKVTTRQESPATTSNSEEDPSPKRLKNVEEDDKEDSTSNKTTERKLGPFSAAERNRADAIFQRIVKDHGISEETLKSFIHAWGSNKHAALLAFKKDIASAFPRRPRRAVYRFCQRTFNAFERGAWTQEQDEALAKAWDETPNRWPEISNQIGRFWEECRDSFRDKVQWGNGMQEGPWDEFEELKLKNTMDELTHEIQMKSSIDVVRVDRDEAEHFINWNTVAKLVGSRTSKQCVEKWNQMKNRHDLALTLMNDWRVPAPRSVPNLSHQRWRDAEKRLHSCSPGDVYVMMAEILDAFLGQPRHFRQDSTFWSYIASTCPKSPYTSNVRRLALQRAVDQYESPEVTSAVSAYTAAEAVKGRIEQLHHLGQFSLDRTYDSTQFPTVAKDKPKKAKTSSKYGASQKKHRKAELSKELISDSESEKDSDDEEDSDDEKGSGNKDGEYGEEEVGKDLDVANGDKPPSVSTTSSSASACETEPTTVDPDE